jgi:sulfate/thiosulfate transport system substrate-binding protein
LAAKQGRTDSSYILPATNISIDAPVAVVDSNVDKHGNRKVAEAFAKFLFTAPAQQEFAKTGFRPVAGSGGRSFCKIAKLYTIGSLGGWDAVDRQFFADGGVFDKIYANR